LLDGAKQLIAEGMPEDAEMLLAKVFDAEPSNKRAGELKQEALKQRAERKRRLELIEKMQAARSLWTQQKYAECAEILTKLQKEYPEEDEIPRLLQTAREDQAEEERKQNLEKARNLLAARRYAECRSVLSSCRRRSRQSEVSSLLNIGRRQANQQKLQKIIEARSLLASRAFDECISILLVLEKDHPSDEEMKGYSPPRVASG